MKRVPKVVVLLLSATVGLVLTGCDAAKERVTSPPIDIMSYFYVSNLQQQAETQAMIIATSDSLLQQISDGNTPEDLKERIARAELQRGELDALLEEQRERSKMLEEKILLIAKKKGGPKIPPPPPPCHGCIALGIMETIVFPDDGINYQLDIFTADGKLIATTKPTILEEASGLKLGSLDLKVENYTGAATMILNNGEKPIAEAPISF